MRGKNLNLYDLGKSNYDLSLEKLDGLHLERENRRLVLDQLIREATARFLFAQLPEVDDSWDEERRQRIKDKKARYRQNKRTRKQISKSMDSDDRPRKRHRYR